MKRIVFWVLLTCSPLQTLGASECGPAKGVHTYWGHMNLVLEYEEQVRSIHGVAVAIGTQNEPVDGVLVELFDHAEIALETHGSQIRTGQKRLAVCATGKDGRFSFDPQPGKYELRLSKKDWNTKSLIVTVSRKVQNGERIEVFMEAGT